MATPVQLYRRYGHAVFIGDQIIDMAGFYAASQGPFRLPIYAALYTDDIFEPDFTVKMIIRRESPAQSRKKITFGCVDE